ncbi:MAG: threonine--tRNA ligase [Candidatus Zambryskibacteria bacterium RIFCSPLOWO2_01_FULL_39_39]|uniref:Threonine--tRNA ligase n=1 Tax=Candidatus Zambryskibacteria bacterium RIFCSPLOWO2_01_FULL_39_39 TaxID=1802758 RepID=A0A1G2TZZ3_9BACT|nr:MAG: threonine--tRNA ligase [Candidatus Zambryskibacteria bacterium RIFCSPHIGHO2_01_FULL_39_63]OHA94844.1 MAG: threonine--tRNA ligase [Candidatus Zambryskibacteria bacterium RIFCSPHIGHO2_02_FULL_39_19]OHA98334.1 MAG: threonine--tRNA ligase [Candidatus Zambryskibacteria bacterium RIFCSPHIGHO2_12_FULL_39_21]OHB02719.1 MAG: threonine--tRNA ligase [Candidatus Zambryskibacteria bacterium RIFCSPLOWO2_01_FULL_39_39]
MNKEKSLDKLETSNIESVRHSLAHLLAAAVKEFYPDAKATIGPAIDNGFYYDFEFSSPISDKDLEKIEEKMKEILPSWKSFEGGEVSADEAREYWKNNEYKIELINEFEGKITFYKSGDFTDLCRGGHVADPSKEISPESFKLDRIAGAYWRGDEKNKMLTRIYGLAFESKEKLDEYLIQREEAEKRDHKKLGKELGLFTISDLVGKGLPMYLPKGNIIRTELENFIRSEKEKLGYSFVTIPHIAKKELYIKSGHLGKYGAMMPTMKDENGEEFVMKAMNCPHHFEIYNAEPHSYRDLPLRLAENTVVYRNEKSGELSGLLRVKSLCQDDTHHFIKQDQIQSEIKMILGLMQKVYGLFGFNDYKVEISVRDPKNKGKYFGDDSVWQKAEAILLEEVTNWGVPFSVEEGEAAFYGPKIDIKVKDSIGREWQLTTIQLDFNQPENFDMNYTGEDGKKHRVVVLHVAILGSFERFMGILIEHYAGNFPLWLSPVQVKVIPVRESHNAYAQEIYDLLKENGVRAEVDLADENLGKKVRQAKNEKIPYWIVLGDKEVESKEVTVEARGNPSVDGGEKLGSMSASKFLELLQKEIKEKN